ncbi:MAG TPA: hypothetical protein VGX95_02675 [Xanthobacteraceae bacterium]|nr:hypothetical protein [Xanthobacteraceae bacterium]
MGSFAGIVMRAVLPLLAALWLAACAQDRQQEHMAELRRQVEAEKQDCDNLYPRDVAGPLHYSQRVRCLNEVEAHFMRPFDPFPDLTDQRLAARKALAADLDAGRLTEADANARLAAKISQIKAEERRRSETTSSISAEATSALAGQRVALGTTCSEHGAAVSCF